MKKLLFIILPLMLSLAGYSQTSTRGSLLTVDTSTYSNSAGFIRPTIKMLAVNRLDNEVVYWDMSSWSTIGTGGSGVNIYNSDGTLTNSRTLSGGSFYNLTFNNLTGFTVDIDGNLELKSNSGATSMYSNTINKQSGFYTGVDYAKLESYDLGFGIHGSNVIVYSDSLLINPHSGNLIIDSLNYSNSTSDRMLVWDTTGANRGKVGYRAIPSTPTSYWSLSGSDLSPTSTSYIVNSGTIFKDSSTSYVPGLMYNYRGDIKKAAVSSVSSATGGYWGYKNLNAGSWSGGTATLTTLGSGGGAHNYVVGNIVKVQSVTPSGYNGTYIITAVPTTTTFSYALTSNPGTYVSGGTSTIEPQAQITAYQLATPAMVISAHPGSVPSGIDAYPPVFAVVGDDNNPLNKSWSVGVDAHSQLTYFGGILKSFLNGAVTNGTSEHTYGWTNSTTASPATGANVDLSLSRVRANWATFGSTTTSGDSSGNLTINMLSAKSTVKFTGLLPRSTSTDSIVVRATDGTLGTIAKAVGTTTGTVVSGQTVIGAGATSIQSYSNNLYDGTTQTLSANGATSTPVFLMTGTPSTAGTTTTDYPLQYFNGGTAPTTWSTNGTYTGWNAVSGFTGNFWDAHVNGGGTVANLSYTGALTTLSSFTTDGSANGRTFAGAVSNYPGFWFGSVTPSLSNYAFLADVGAGQNIINATTEVDFRTGNTDRLKITATSVTATIPITLKGYTVATLPAGVVGMTAYVTDALAPTFLATVVGGGSVVTPVFYNGSNWVGY